MDELSHIGFQDELAAGASGGHNWSPFVPGLKGPGAEATPVFPQFPSAQQRHGEVPRHG
jgi:hypothetical protein